MILFAVPVGGGVGGVGGGRGGVGVAGGGGGVGVGGGWGGRGPQRGVFFQKSPYALCENAYGP